MVRPLEAGAEIALSKPAIQLLLWFHGGKLHRSRQNSQFLALQRKAREEGIDTPVSGTGNAQHPE